jgi:peptidoglycan/LPS O-acetylase OafA/YrhL
MVGEHTRYLATRYFSSLDGLRCLSILPVVWHHSTPRPLPGLAGKGPAGVDLFFCISGYLITTLLLRERAERGAVSLPAFYARRALRLLPLYYLVLLAYVALALALPSDAPQRAHFFRTLPFYATFTANWFADFGVSHAILFSFAWSLCIEEQFYAFWPWLVQRLPPSGAALAMLGVLALDYAAESGAFPSLPSLPLRIVTSFAAPIGLGALLALALHSAPGFALLAPILGRKYSALVTLAVALWLLAEQRAPLFVFQLALAALVGAAVIPERQALSPVFEARPVRYLGRVSYALYLLNLTAIGAVRRLFPGHVESSLFVFALALPLAIALAALAHHFVEQPLIRLRARYRAVPIPALDQ